MEVHIKEYVLMSYKLARNMLTENIACVYNILKAQTGSSIYGVAYREKAAGVSLQ